MRRRCIRSFIVFSTSGTGNGGLRKDKIVEALIDLANKINFAPDDNIVEDTKPVNQEASAFDAIFEELQ